MNKALFLIFTFCLPAIFIFPPSEHISYIWILIYSPIALCYPIYIFRKPDNMMIKLGSFTPLIYFIVALPISFILNQYMGVLAASLFTMITILQLGLVVGYLYFGFIYFLYLILKRVGLLATDS